MSATSERFGTCRACGERRTVHGHHPTGTGPGRIHWHPLIIVWLCLVCHAQVHAYLKRRRGWPHPEGWNDPNAPMFAAVRIRMAATLRLLAGNQRDDARDVLDLAADLLEEQADA